MTSWKATIHTCIGTGDLKFAGHPSDEGRAFRLLDTLREEGVGWEEFSAALESHYETGGAPTDITVAALKRAELLFRPWMTP